MRVPNRLWSEERWLMPLGIASGYHTLRSKIRGARAMRSDAPCNQSPEPSGDTRSRTFLDSCKPTPRMKLCSPWCCS